MQCRGVAYCRYPKETDLPLLTETFECRYDFVEYLSDAERRSAFSLGNRIVQMEDVDPIAT